MQIIFLPFFKKIELFCFGFAWQGFGSWFQGRKLRKLLEAFPISSRAEPLLDKAEPISNDGIRNTTVISSLSYSELIENKSNWFPWVESVLPTTVTGERPLPVLTLTHELFVVFSLPCSTEQGNEWLWWAPGVQPGSPTTLHPGSLTYNEHCLKMHLFWAAWRYLLSKESCDWPF